VFIGGDRLRRGNQKVKAKKARIRGVDTGNLARAQGDKSETVKKEDDQVNTY
jgi:hypothetical protein